MTEQRRPQRRGRKIAMTDAEVDAFLASERTCRVATVGTDGPHATPLWFCWDGSAFWLYSIVRSQRWADLARDPRIGVVVDAGVEFAELRGVEITGRVDVVGPAPYTDEQPEPGVHDVDLQFARKYLGGSDTMYHDGRHGWLRIRPEKIVSWDFRKICQG